MAIPAAIHPRSAGTSAQPKRPDVAGGTDLAGLLPGRDDVPTLYVVVDVAAEPGWRSAAFARSQAAPGAMGEPDDAQAIFEHYGARPIYCVDFATTSQPAVCGPVARLLARHACVVGALMNGGEGAQVEREISLDLERIRLSRLHDAVERAFGVPPLFFRTDGYGIGRDGLDCLAKLGFSVDLSTAPPAGLRPGDGPDTWARRKVSFRGGGSGILRAPVTRGRYRPLAPLPQELQDGLPMPLVRLGLVNTVTLTPVETSAEEQIRLVKAQVARGIRLFVLHHCGPPPGMHAPSVASQADRQALFSRIRAVCRFFFETLGGLPGNPADLVPLERRLLLWPQPDASPPVAARPGECHFRPN